MARSLVEGPDVPEHPFPVAVKTHITSGFGRGSSELGIPTANIPPGELASLDPGVYYGWARVRGSGTHSAEESHKKLVGDREIEFNYGTQLKASDQEIFPMVMSIGWNPFFKNKEKSAEVHILHKFVGLFYGAQIGVVVAGFIRPERSYDSLDALVEDIHFDIEVAKHSLARERYIQLKELLD